MISTFAPKITDLIHFISIAYLKVIGDGICTPVYPYQGYKKKVSFGVLNIFLPFVPLSAPGRLAFFKISPLSTIDHNIFNNF